jgi:hypothetical protein
MSRRGLAAQAALLATSALVAGSGQGFALRLAE